MKLAIVGSRTFSDIALLRSKLQNIIRVENVDLIISGGSTGADSLAERLAGEFKIPMQIFPADWTRFGKSAGPRRNADIAAVADKCLACLDKPLEKSRGTANVVKMFRFLRKSVEFIRATR